MDVSYFSKFIDNLVSYKTSLDLANLPYTREQVILVGAIVASSTIVYYYTKYTYWSSRNINGPTPIPPFGTLVFDLIYSRNRMLRAYTKRYGRLYGVYNGVKPVLVCSDYEIIKKVLVKDAHIFINRKSFEFMGELSRGMLFMKRDDEWKQLRSLMAFTMTSGKIKKMYNLMKSSSDELIDCINKTLANNEPIDIKLNYGCFTLDVIARCAFAMKFDSEESEQKYRKDLVNRLTEDLKEFPIVKLLVFVCLPKFILRAIKFEMNNGRMQRNLSSLTKKIIASRRSNDKLKAYDVLQLLMDLKRSSETISLNNVEIVEGDSKESHHVADYDKQELYDTIEELNAQKQNSPSELITKGDRMKLKLNDIEIVANCMFFLVAGYETTSSLLSFATYSLACHPSVQEKLYEEVKSCIEREAQAKPTDYFEYETVLSMELLDAVISETLRMFPPAPILERQASEDYKISTPQDITIEAGEIIVIPAMSVHYDPEYYPEPNRFDPSRFLPENRHKLTPYTYLPFGAGIRHCLGMRFALAEAKLALARLVYNFRFSPAKGTEARFPPKLAKTFLSLRSDELDVTFSKR